MKSKTRLLMVIVITSILVSCGNKNSLVLNIPFDGYFSGLVSFFHNGLSTYDNAEEVINPPVEEVAKKYLIALEKGRFGEAKTLVTDESKATIDFMAQLFEMGGEEAKKAAAESIVEIKEVNCVTMDTIANCSCSVKNGKEVDQTMLHLIKIDGKWLVEQKKEGLSPDESSPNPNADSLKAN